MRTPLLVLIAAYTISVGGLVLMPGVDDQGHPWHFDFFHAFYFVSFMGSTIGFGEIPYEFTDAQRFWVLLSIYLTVVAWLYAIGGILSLMQDPALKRVMTEQSFTRSVKRLNIPFYIICGYGETGVLLVRSLARRNIQTVVLENNPDRVNQLPLQGLPFDIPHLCADASEARFLVEAGLKHPHCQGVVTLANDDTVNIKIAITAKLLNKKLKVISRSESHATTANLASFNTDHIVNPYEYFADHLAMSLRIPTIHLLYDWLVGNPGRPLSSPITPPRGTWIVCGYGRFGQAVDRYMEFEGIQTVIVDPDKNKPGVDITGYGTEAVTLREAGISKAVGIVAGTDKDANNLSIIMTARELNPDLYIIARQNRHGNNEVFRAAKLNLVMQSNRVTVWRILPYLTQPMLGRFLRMARHRNESWGIKLARRIRELTHGATPHSWTIIFDKQQAPAFFQMLTEGKELRLKDILGISESRQNSAVKPILALLLSRPGCHDILLPKESEILQPGDKLLCCAEYPAERQLNWLLANDNCLRYTLSGEERPTGYVWQTASRLLGHSQE